MSLNYLNLGLIFPLMGKQKGCGFYVCFHCVVKDAGNFERIA